MKQKGRRKNTKYRKINETKQKRKKNYIKNEEIIKL